MADLHGGAMAKITIKVKDWDLKGVDPQMAGYFVMAQAGISCKVDGFANPLFLSQSQPVAITKDGQLLEFTLPVPNPWANYWDKNTRDDIPAFQGDLVISYFNPGDVKGYPKGSAGGGIACWTDCRIPKKQKTE